MRFGVMFANVGPMAHAEGAIGIAQAAEAGGIVVGGHSKAAARRAGRLGDGFFPGKGNHKDLAQLIQVMRAAAVEHGRDPDAIEITSGGDGALGAGALDEVKRLAEMGVSRVIIPPLAFDVQGQRDAFARYGDEVILRC